ncbi:MAG: 16S rRNA (cytosine(967)-C(5))-methyltransferase RsmB [Oxalobacteraceae bacterium]|nr:16S rRNA (cytosine(967)-C(5))-methyltransferase RsmB [Oxalobacteraceae bacterium]
MSESLSLALHHAAHVLTKVEAGQALPAALADVFNRHTLSPASRGAIQDISYRSMRRWACAHALMNLLASKPPSPARLGALICCALALLSDDTPPYTEHTLVDQAVEACAQDPELSRAKGMVNAVLRRFLRERDSLMQTVLRDDEARLNYPRWWIDAIRRAWPQQAEAVLEAGNREPPLTLRVNTRKTNIEAYLAQLAAAGVVATRIGDYAVRLKVEEGMRVLDACAAPGGKTGHLLELANCDVLALDHDEQRLNRVSDNLKRLSLDAKLQVGDARSRDWWDGQPYDRILADLPCTASGIVRRHPDIRWLRRPEDGQQLAKRSAEILDNLWGMLRPGGLLLIVTCSVWPEESELQAQAFVRRQNAVRLDAPGQLLPQADEASDHDGLFYALLRKPAL